MTDSKKPKILFHLGMFGLLLGTIIFGTLNNIFNGHDKEFKSNIGKEIADCLDLWKTGRNNVQRDIK
jgi:hypothetical protein